jgi:hypothetical protein
MKRTQPEEQVARPALHETITRARPARNDLVAGTTNKGNGETPPKPNTSTLTLLLTFPRSQWCT